MKCAKCLPDCLPGFVDFLIFALLMAKRKRSVTIIAAWIVGLLALLAAIFAAILPILFDNDHGDAADSTEVIVLEPTIPISIDSLNVVVKPEYEKKLNQIENPFQKDPPKPQIVQSDTNYVRLKVQYLGFQDAGLQLDYYGCPNGRYFATLNAAIIEKMEASWENVNHDVWLGPMDVMISVNTNIPSEDYIRITDLIVEIVDYEDEPKFPQILFYNTVCADLDPGGEEVRVNVNLKGQKIPISFMKRVYKEKPLPPFIIWQNNPTSIRFDVNASDPGWYQYNIIVKYVYRNIERTIMIEKPIQMFIPYNNELEWYYSTYNGSSEFLKVYQLSRDEVQRVSKQLFLPRDLAPDTLRNEIIPN